VVELKMDGSYSDSGPDEEELKMGLVYKES
jgi:hypothetical protein